MHDLYDVIIIGGGPAGLAAALTLGRSRRSTLLLDSGEPRNAPSLAVHNLFTRDGTPPAELRRIGREQLAAYPTVEVRDTAVADQATTATDGIYELHLADGETVAARRLLLATGVVDELPETEGLAGLWGRSVLHCPYCHGFEVRDTPLAVLGAEPDRVRLALHLTRFSDDVALLTDGPADLGHAAELLERHGVAVRTEPVARLDGRDGQLQAVVFASGERLPRHALFTHGRLRQRSKLPELLGCELLDDGSVRVDDFGRTSVPGVAAAGDMARRPSMPRPFAAVVAAAASGTIAAAVLDQDLVAADFGLQPPAAGR